ncbi:TadE/TadG family type IV pilus assembly protein [Microvirga yunnanensis]|uniref:TadE/TadG family type IV pilus assembly protein n=1 Tax=Microvirga yunnanensis TaxID=2953740 RepID=UPI0021C6E587|nr:TadE/TadG family type IV pilus assembly protein [Microvirga sp. HBU65207]
MTRIHQLFFRFHRCQSGVAAIEFALVGSLLILVSLGVIEFGRGLLVRNEISYLADLGSRQILLNPDVSESTLRSQMQAEFSGEKSLLQLATTLETLDGAKYRSIKVSYPLTLLVPGLTDSPMNLSITRRVPLGWSKLGT